MPLADALRAGIARSLEGGRAEKGWASPPSPALTLVARAWEAFARPRIRRPLRIPGGVAVVGVGGATLGGAGKTPVAIALARALAEAGRSVALVGHAYRAEPGKPRVVAVDDAVGVAGDDALAAARLLAGDGVPVVVAPSRQAAVDHAASIGARILVVDGLLQTAPEPLADAVLVLDGDAPWGAGACPPLGDLRASTEALLAAADHVAVVTRHTQGQPDRVAVARAIVVHSEIGGAIDGIGRRFELEALAGRRVGLLLAVARPERLVRALADHGIVARLTIALADHALFAPEVLARAAQAGVDAWLTTARCATKLPPAIAGAPVLALDHRVDVAQLAARLQRSS